MDLGGKNGGTMTTPAKDRHRSRSKASETENSNPNQSIRSPLQKQPESPVIKSEKSKKKSGPKPSYQIVSPRAKIQERKFVVAKRNSKNTSTVTCKCKDKMGGNPKKCHCVAYESLRASQEEFFKNTACVERDPDLDKLQNFETDGVSDDKSIGGKGSSPDSSINHDLELSEEKGSSNIKRTRNRLLEEARSSIPEAGSGRVLHLVKAFERILSIPRSKDETENEETENEGAKKPMKWALPGLQPKAPETEASSSSFNPSEPPFFTAENFGSDTRISSSLDSSQGSFTFTSRTSAEGGGRRSRSRRNSSESSATLGGRKWKKKQLKATTQQPFQLKTEERGRLKEEEFLKKVQEMVIEEERQRIPIAQGLPWTTDEPECLVKPPVKEITNPIDLKLHSDLRAVERAGFDNQVAEKLNIIEQYRLERERQQKLAEEEEIRRLRRKELIPKAQPMPYFDKPFIPKRSLKLPTVPIEPKFHIPQHKKIKCMSWNDLNIYTHQH